MIMAMIDVFAEIATTVINLDFEDAGFGLDVCVGGCFEGHPLPQGVVRWFGEGAVRG